MTHVSKRVTQFISPTLHQYLEYLGEQFVKISVPQQLPETQEQLSQYCFSVSFSYFDPKLDCESKNSHIKVMWINNVYGKYWDYQTCHDPINDAMCRPNAL